MISLKVILILHYIFKVNVLTLMHNLKIDKMITKEEYLKAVEQHLESKKLINEFHSQINKSINEVAIEKQLKQYSKDTNLLSLFPNKEAFSLRTRNFLARNMNSHYYQKENALFDENSTIADLIKAYYNRELHKQRLFGKTTKNEIKTFIETKVI